VYAGGAFTSIGGRPRNCIAALDATTGAVTDWNPDADGVVWSLAASASTIYAGGGFARMGVFPAANVAAITSAPSSPSTSRGSVILTQNAPNPSRSFTVIRFALDAAGPVSLEVFDLQGRRVATLLDRQPHEAGAHEVPLRTEGWAPGCYLYRLEEGGATATRKILVLK